MAHILFVDNIEKLNVKKDSSLMMALSLQEKGEESFLLFEEDFFVANTNVQQLKLFPFSGKFKDDGYYLESFELGDSTQREVSSNDIIHMRIDPPYDQRYQRYLWMLDYLQRTKSCQVLNNPLGIMKYNEKLCTFSLEYHVKSYVGASVEMAKEFAHELGEEELILKPLDLYSGIGVEKIHIDDIEKKFEAKVKEFGGAIIVQPFLKEVLKGEYRSIYFDGKELGSIIKTPQAGEFLTNIAQGANFEKVELPENLKQECENVSKELLKDGVRFVAFDLLGDCITEVNVTCPGLLVEVSYAHNKNFASLITDLIIG